MFPLKPRDELVFGISTNNIISSTQSSQNISLNYLDFTDHANFQVCNTTAAATTTINFDGNANQNPRSGRGRGGNDIDIKRALHRNLERQRRQEMSQLYASLRSLLPLHHIKGKHSLSDLMHESRDYIKELQNNVQELRARRDKMKKLGVSSSTGNSGSNGTRVRSPNQVEVNKEQDGVEILISSASEFGMSSVMNVLMRSELSVVSCMSTKINGRFLHKIQAEAIDLKHVDLSRLKERLTDMIN